MNLAAYNKAIVALIMAIIGFVNLFWGLPFNPDPTTVTAIVTAITPILVYLVPNIHKT